VGTVKPKGLLAKVNKASWLPTISSHNEGFIDIIIAYFSYKVKLCISLSQYSLELGGRDSFLLGGGHIP